MQSFLSKRKFVALYNFDADVDDQGGHASTGKMKFDAMILRFLNKQKNFEYLTNS